MVYFSYEIKCKPTYKKRILIDYGMQDILTKGKSIH